MMDGRGHKIMGGLCNKIIADALERAHFSDTELLCEPSFSLNSSTNGVAADSTCKSAMPRRHGFVSSD